MDTTKHTPGPWAVDAEEAIRIRATDESAVATVNHLRGRHGIKGRIQPDEAMSNARLIAAAPELLEALKEAHHQLHSLLAVFVPDTDGAHATTADVMAQARAALAKAEGRTDG